MDQPARTPGAQRCRRKFLEYFPEGFRDPEYIELERSLAFVMQGQAPRTVIVVKVKEAYIQCSRALVRSDLWNPAKYAAPGKLPSMGTVMAKHTCGFVNAQDYDEEAQVRVPATLY